MLPETTASAAVREALESVANDLGAATFQGPPNELLVPFGRRFADTGRANLLVVDVTGERPDFVEAARLAQAFGTAPLILVDRDVDGSTPASSAPSVSPLPYVEYERSGHGLRRLQEAFRTLLRQRRPPRSRWRSPPAGSSTRETYQFDQLPMHRRELLTHDVLRALGYRRLRHSTDLPLIEMLAEPPYVDGRGLSSETLCLIASRTLGHAGALRRVVQHDLPALGAALQQIRRAPAPPPAFLPFPSRLTVILFMPFLAPDDDPTQGEMLDELPLRFEELSDQLETPVGLEIYDRRRLLAILRSNPQIAARYFDLTTGALVRANEEHLPWAREERLPDPHLNAIREQLDHERELRIAAEREAAWKDVAFTAAHKLGNPLFAIETNLQELVDVADTSDKGVVDIIQDISTSVEKAKVIIEHFKSLTKFQNIAARPTDIVPLIRTSCAPARAMGIKTRVSAPKEGPLLLVDPALITHCLDELIGNAYHFFDKPSKRLAVTLTAPAEVPEELYSRLQPAAYARLRVSDNGRGVPKSLKDSIFTPFFSTRGGGSGFGLSMIRSVVEGHGGIIREVGREKRGAIFEMFLPIAEAAAPAGGPDAQDGQDGQDG
jgi:signal transduction histidine kinase